MISMRRTLEPAGAVDVLVRGSAGLELPGTLKTELHASVVELNTGICDDADDAVAALRELRGAAIASRARTGSSSPLPARTRAHRSSPCPSCRRSATSR